MGGVALCALLSAILALACAAKSQPKAQQINHEQAAHAVAPDQKGGMRDAHAGHAPAETGKPGEWSYLGRQNPKSFAERRWEMVPVPGYGHMYLNTGNLSPDLICAALRDNPAVMADRATRTKCGMPETPAAAPGMPPEKKEIEHLHPGAAPMRDDEHEGMHEHWTAPPDAAARKNPVLADQGSVDRGRKLYQLHCTVCHGKQGKGDGPAAAGLSPRPPDLAEMAGQHPDGDLAWKIESGKGPMPAWKDILTENQVWDLVNFIKSLGRTGGQPDNRHDHGH
jgi:mono/diheme cytochrome c family protein